MESNESNNSIVLKKCYQCYRPLKSCYCRWITRIDTGIKFLYLIHPREANKMKTGTGRLASLIIQNSELLVGIDFSSHPRVNALLSDESCLPVLLYPGTHAYPLADAGFKSVLGSKKLLVIIVDATWPMSRKIIRLSKNLQLLTQVSFSNPYTSRFTLKQQPYPHCLSTIESTYYVIRELQNAGITDPSININGLLLVQKKIVDYQRSFC